VIRVLIADDHALVRRGVIQVLSDAADIQAADEAASGQAVLQAVGGHCDFDVLLLDMALPDMSGLEVLKHVQTLKPALPVLILSIYSEKQYALRCLRAGAAGYLTKDSAPDELIAAIRRVAAGGRYVTQTLAELLAAELESPAGRALHHTLSDREDQVLRRLAAGQTVGAIAADLALSPKTVSTYRSRILEKLRLETTADLIRYALEHDLQL